VPVALGPWQGEYFNNRYLSGTPAVVRTDAAVAFDWGWESPAPGVKPDDFSVRWSGTFPFDAGSYRITTTSDDGVRVTVDGQPVINAWYPMRGTRTGSVTLAAGSHHVQVEYFEGLQAAHVRLDWERLDAGVGEAAVSAPTGGCTAGPLTLEAWALDRAWVPGGWMATIYARASGGDCQYSYGWERQVERGPTADAVTFEVTNPQRGAMVGEVFVTSAGKTAKVGLYIRAPER
jgi:hypothetical protein